jgi:hypothetical protein
MGLHRSRASPREDWLWRIVFQTDRYTSLMINRPYSVTDAQCNITCNGSAPDPMAKSYDPMTILAILVGKVLDNRQIPNASSYSSVLEIDRELNFFGSQMPAEPWKIDPSDKRKSRGTRFRVVGGHITHFIFFQAKLILHFPWMLKSTTDPDLEYSRTSCVEAARGILRLFQVRGGLQLAEAVRPYKSSPEDFIGFIAAATLILCQAGYGPLWEDPTQLQEDQGLVCSADQIYRRTPTKAARQISSVLQKMNRLREGHGGIESAPTKLLIPFLGDVMIPGREKIIHNVYHEPPSLINTSMAPSFCNGSCFQIAPVRDVVQQSVYVPNALMGNNLQPALEPESTIPVVDDPAFLPTQQAWSSLQNTDFLHSSQVLGFCFETQISRTLTT